MSDNAKEILDSFHDESEADAMCALMREQTGFGVQDRVYVDDELNLCLKGAGEAESFMLRGFVMGYRRGYKHGFRDSTGHTRIQLMSLTPKRGLFDD